MTTTAYERIVAALTGAGRTVIDGLRGGGA